MSPEVEAGVFVDRECSGLRRFENFGLGANYSQARVAAQVDRY
jgi:hypothetical protein